MTSPTTGGELQQFVCAVNWMRASIPNFTTLIRPLQLVLDAAADQVKSRKKQQLYRVPLASVGWGDDQERALADVKTALLKMVPLAPPRADFEVCLFTDASLDHWGAVVTQVP